MTEKSRYLHPDDGAFFPCMIAARIKVGVGDSGGAVLVRGIPAGVSSRELRRMARVHGPGRGAGTAGAGALHDARLRARAARAGS